MIYVSDIPFSYTAFHTYYIYIDNCPFLPDKIYRIETVISIISPTKTVIEATQL